MTIARRFYVAKRAYVTHPLIEISYLFVAAFNVDSALPRAGLHAWFCCRQNGVSGQRKTWFAFWRLGASRGASLVSSRSSSVSGCFVSRLLAISFLDGRVSLSGDLHLVSGTYNARTICISAGDLVDSQGFSGCPVYTLKIC